MTTPPVPERLAEIAREAVHQLEAAGEPITRDTLMSTSGVSLMDLFESATWALEVAVAEYLRERS